MTAFNPILCEGLPGGIQLDHCLEYLRLVFPKPLPVLSSAVLNGGAVLAQQIINRQVSGASAAVCELPEQTLANFCEQQDWPSETVGMMTAASMKSARLTCAEIEGEQLAVFVTAGIANARRAGDRGDYQQLDDDVRHIGTINTMVLCSARLDTAVMAEMIMLAAEAKAALLQELDVRSPISRKIATGTGTDAIAIVSGESSRQICYAGKHTLFGETLAQMVMNATRDSLQYDLLKAVQ